jgi:anti-sigma28 factor (negative regulator of flagellin synthesis)
MKISQISQMYGVELHKAAGNKKVDSKTDKPKAADSVNVSKTGEALNSAAASSDTAAKRVEALPEVRWDKVNSVKERVESGFYNTQEFREDLADKLIQDFGIENKA